MAMSQAGRGGRRTSDFGFPSARSTVGRRSGSPPKPRPSGLFGGDAAYNTANPPPVGRVPSHGDRFAESLLAVFLIFERISLIHSYLAHCTRRSGPSPPHDTSLVPPMYLRSTYVVPTLYLRLPMGGTT